MFIVEDKNHYTSSPSDKHNEHFGIESSIHKLFEY